MFLEGFTMGFLYMAGAFFAVMFFKSSSSKYWIVRTIFPLFFLAAFITIATIIHNAYTMKTRWYSSSNTFPKELSEMLFSTVKKKDGLLKRLIRFGRYILLEAQGWTDLKAQGEALIGRYVVRLINAWKGEA